MNLQDTIVIELNSNLGSTDYIATASLDDELNEDTSFGPGSEIHLWLHLSANIRVDSVEVTDGTVESSGDGARETVSQVLFSSKETATEHTTDVIPSSTSMKFYGNVGEPTETIGDFGVVTYTANDFENVPYIVDITNTFPVLLFTVTAPDVTLEADESYPVGIVFYLSEIGA